MPPNGPLHPYTPEEPPMPLMPPIPLLDPECLHSLPAPQYAPTPPDCPSTPPGTPTPPNFLSLPLCNWLSSQVSAVYNIPSVVVKNMSAVLWSSANFCNISKTCTPKLQLLHNIKRPTKWSEHGNMIDPHKNFYIWTTFYPGSSKLMNWSGQC